MNSSSSLPLPIAMPDNREAWLTMYAKALEPYIKETTGLTPRSYRVACGWPSRGGMSMKNRTIGQCQVGGSVKGIQDIFISPALDDIAQVTETLLHELLHAALPAGAGHRKPFSQAAKKTGLEGKPTATYAGEDLKYTLSKLAAPLGPYPHDRIDVGGLPKQTTRLLKAQCPVCGYIVRVTAKWLDEAGAPVCPQCSVEMVAGDIDAPSDPLVAVDQIVEYKIKAEKGGMDPRWSVRMHRRGRNMQWHIIDYGTDILLPSPARLTPAESRQEAIDLIDSLREGLLTYKDLEADDADISGDWDPEDLEYLAEDEDEEPDNEDGFVDPDEEDDYIAEQTNREAWVTV